MMRLIMRSGFKNTFMVVLNLAIVGLGCYDGSDLRSTEDAPKNQLPPSGYSHGAPVPQVEARSSALWVNPPAGNCFNEQPANTIRIFRYDDNGSGGCLQFGSNIEITNLGNYFWDNNGTSLNDRVTKVIGSVYPLLGKTQRVQLWSESNLWGSTASHQVTYTGQPGQGWNVWLYNPWNFNFGASSLRYETW